MGSRRATLSEVMDVLLPEVTGQGANFGQDLGSILTTLIRRSNRCKRAPRHSVNRILSIIESSCFTTEPICRAAQLRESILYLCRRHSAALMINSATSLGWESIATWLDGNSIAMALAASA